MTERCCSGCGHNVLDVESASQRDFTDGHNIFFAIDSSSNHSFIPHVTATCRALHAKRAQLRLCAGGDGSRNGIIGVEYKEIPGSLKSRYVLLRCDVCVE